MQRYRCYKLVDADLIVGSYTREEWPEQMAIPADAAHGIRLQGGEWVNLTTKEVARHVPEVGEYFVVYRDGYRSFSPAKEFEDGYTPLLEESTGPVFLEPFGVLVQSLSNIDAAYLTLRPEAPHDKPQITEMYGLVVVLSGLGGIDSPRAYTLDEATRHLRNLTNQMRELL